MHKPLISVIIVNWNGIKYLNNCLSSLFQNSYQKMEVLFVDNASTDSSVEYVKKNFPKVKIFQNKTNLGFAQAHDAPFKHVKGELVLFLSMDTIMKKNFLINLIKRIETDKTIGAVQPKLLLAGSDYLIDSLGAFLTLTGLLYHYGREKDANAPKYNISFEVYTAKGACILFRKHVLDKSGLFDKDYFAYFEETDLCHRVWLTGYRIVYEPKSEVYHIGGGASGKMRIGFITYHAYKNVICTYIKNLSWRYLLRIVPLTIFLYQVAAFIYLVRCKFSAAIAVEKALIWNVAHVNETYNKRLFIQSKIRKIQDKDFLPRLIKHVGWKYYFYQFFGSLKYYMDKPIIS